MLSGNTLYGTTYGGGTNGDGTVFAVNTDGTGFTNLYEFSGTDGRGPYGPLTLSGNVLYGTTSGSGFGFGTVFAVNTDGTRFTNLFTFNDTVAADYGNNSIAGLVLSGNTLYGTTELGDNGEGTVFAVNTDGTGFTNLYLGSIVASCPHAGLLLSGNTLYGVMSQGGVHGEGTVFAIKTDGTGYTNLYSFSPTIPVPPSGSVRTNADGAVPIATLLLSGNTLFGTTSQGGTGGSGTVFRLNTDGTGFTNLYNFAGAGKPILGVLSGNTLYGTSSGPGRVFAVNTDGTGYTNLVGLGFNGQDLGYPPAGGLVLSGHTLYGTQTAGGTFNGSVFAVTLPPPGLNIHLNNGAVILTWNDPTSDLLAPDRSRY